MKRHDLFTWEGESKSMKRMHRTILGLVASVVMVGALALFGCGDGGGDHTEACSATNLASRVFTFNGAPFNLGTITLTIGPAGTTFELKATIGVPRTITGTISYNPLTLTVLTVNPSTPSLPGGFPGVGTSFAASSCTLDTDSGQVTITNPTGSTGTSGG
jgi:hypothetical protein